LWKVFYTSPSRPPNSFPNPSPLPPHAPPHPFSSQVPEIATFDVFDAASKAESGSDDGNPGVGTAASGGGLVVGGGKPLKKEPKSPGSPSKMDTINQEFAEAAMAAIAAEEAAAAAVAAAAFTTGKAKYNAQCALHVQVYVAQLLVRLLQCPSAEIQSYSASCLARAAMTEEGRQTIKQSGGIEALLGLLCDALDAETQACAARALMNMSTEPRFQVYICKRGLYALLQVSWNPQCDEAGACVGGTLANLSRNPKNCTMMYRAELHIKAKREGERAFVPDLDAVFAMPFVRPEVPGARPGIEHLSGGGNSGGGGGGGNRGGAGGGDNRGGGGGGEGRSIAALLAEEEERVPEEVKLTPFQKSVLERNSTKLRYNEWLYGIEGANGKTGKAGKGGGGKKKKKKKKKTGKKGMKTMGGKRMSTDELLGFRGGGGGQRRSTSSLATSKRRGSTGPLLHEASLPDLALSPGEAPVFELPKRLRHPTAAAAGGSLHKTAPRGAAADVGSKYNQPGGLGRLPCLQNALLAPIGSMWVSSPFDPDDTSKQLATSLSTGTALTLAGTNSVVLTRDEDSRYIKDVPRWSPPQGLVKHVAPVRAQHYTMTPLPLPGRPWPRYNLPLRPYHYQSPPSKGLYACFVDDETFPVVPQTMEAALVAHWWRGGVGGGGAGGAGGAGGEEAADASTLIGVYRPDPPRAVRPMSHLFECDNHRCGLLSKEEHAAKDAARAAGVEEDVAPNQKQVEHWCAVERDQSHEVGCERMGQLPLPRMALRVRTVNVDDVLLGKDNSAYESMVWRRRVREADAKSVHDDDACVKRMFTIDWGRARRTRKFRRYIRSTLERVSRGAPVDDAAVSAAIGEIGEQLEASYRVVLRNFDFYSILGKSDAVDAVEYPQFLLFCSDATITDAHHCSEHELELMFVAANLEEEEEAGEAGNVGGDGGGGAEPMDNDANPDDAINRHEFVECLVRLAVARFVLSDKTKDLATAVRRLLQGNVASNTGEGNHNLHVHDREAWRSEYLYTPYMDQLLLPHISTLRSVFREYLTDSARQQKQDCMTLPNFVRLLRRLQFIDDKFVTAEAEARAAFKWGKMHIVDEYAGRARLEYVTFLEFVEALCRVASLADCPSTDDLCAMQKLGCLKSATYESYSSAFNQGTRRTRFTRRLSTSWRHERTRTMCERVSIMLQQAYVILDGDHGGSTEWRAKSLVPVHVPGLAKVERQKKEAARKASGLSVDTKQGKERGANGAGEGSGGSGSPGSGRSGTGSGKKGGRRGSKLRRSKSTKGVAGSPATPKKNGKSVRKGGQPGTPGPMGSSSGQATNKGK
jgi:uncharacterized membrane protein YgcG